MDQTVARPPLEAAPAHGLGPRSYGAMNWLGLWTLCLRETRRFWKVGMQTLFAPVDCLLYTSPSPRDDL